MIFVYCLNNIYKKYNIYIDLLIKNDIKLILFDKDIEVSLNKYNHNNILIDYLDKNNIEKYKDYNNLYLLNIKNININEDYSYLENCKLNIIYYNSTHYKFLKKYTKSYFLPFLLDKEYIFNYNKIYDVAVLNIEKENIKNIVDRLYNKNIITSNIDQCDKDNFYNILFKHKILLFFDNNTMLDEIICNYCIFNKVIIIIVNNDNNLNYSNTYLIQNFIIFVPYNFVDNLVLYILNNYYEIHKNIFDELNLNLISNDFYNIFLKKINKKLKDDFGFIMIRHINSERSNNYWIECYNSIRKFYDNKIIIIDDDSNYNYIKNDIELLNCEIIESEYKKCGELLPYYYYYKYYFFKKAIILHDSVFIHKFINFNNIEKIKFIWHFTHEWDNEENELYLLNKIDNFELKKFYFHKEKWYGCYGVQSIIEYNFLVHLQEKYNIFQLLDYIKNREHRMCIERIFSLICSYEYVDLQNNPSIYGIIHHYIHWGYTFEKYLEDKNKNNLDHLDLVKVWSGR